MTNHILNHDVKYLKALMDNELPKYYDDLCVQIAKLKRKLIKLGCKFEPNRQQSLVEIKLDNRHIAYIKNTALDEMSVLVVLQYAYKAARNLRPE